MLRRFSVDFALLSMLLDALLIAVALGLAVYFRVPLSVVPIVENIQNPPDLPLPIYAIFSVIWVLVLVLFSVYDARRNLHVTDEIAGLALGSLLASVSLAGVLYLSVRDVSRILFITFAVLAFAFLLTWRLLARLAFRSGVLHAVEVRRVLIIGADQMGREIQKRILEYSSLGLRLVGFLDEDLDGRANALTVLGCLKDTKAVVERERIDDVVVALPRQAAESMNQLMAELHILPVRVWVIPDYFSLALHRASVEEFAGIPMLDLRAPALTDYQRALKRAFDVLITLGLMPVVLPLLGIIAVAIRIDRSGPVIFRQKRVGENGRLFEMYKFRTMVQNAYELRSLVEHVDEQGHLIHKTPQDPRVTRVGQFLRRTSLDELPQLFNVLEGEMSLVGPRPELPFLVDRYELWQRKRFSVPQGITGWWQVNGRSDKPMHLHTAEDLYYVQNYSLLFDLWIMLKTILVVLRGKGAY
jgi:exopolysaccharide biosynthesis polyprenyl glycosylphosphotransferase